LGQEPCSGKTGNACTHNRNFQGPVGLRKMAHDNPSAAVELVRN
jgi:hypothetical protein